jgi:hypothetical protein
MGNLMPASMRGFGPHRKQAADPASGADAGYARKLGRGNSLGKITSEEKSALAKKPVSRMKVPSMADVYSLH